MILLHQRSMTAFLKHFTVLQVTDLVGMQNQAQAMGNDDEYLSTAKMFEE